MEEKNFNEAFGQRVKSRREELGITQDELAHKIGYKNRSTVSGIEAGTRTVNPEFINALASRTTPLWRPLCRSESCSGRRQKNKPQANDMPCTCRRPRRFLSDKPGRKL